MTAPAHARTPGRSPARGAGRAGRGSRRLAGVLVIVLCALVPAEVWVRDGMREPVLALARPVAAGQVITGPDLTVVRVSAAGLVSVIPASRRDRVTGRPAAASLPAGSLLAPGDIGGPPPGRSQAQVGVALAPGRYPPGLSPGQRVDIVVPGTCAGTTRLAGQAVVLSVTAPAAGQVVAGLQVPQDIVPQVVAAGGHVSLAVIPAAR